MESKDYSFSGSYTESNTNTDTFSNSANNNYNNSSYYEEKDEIVSTGNWFWTMFICAIPVVNLIFLLIWSFSSGTNKNKQNFARAKLFWLVITTILSFIFSFIIFYALAPLL